MVEIRTLDLADADHSGVWDAFVRAHAAGSVFHLAAWGKSIARAMGHHVYSLAAYKGTELVGILPLIHIRSRLFGNSLSSSAFAVYGGPLTFSSDVADALDAKAWALAQQLGVTALEYRHQVALRPGWASKADTYATFRRPLAGTEEENLKAVPRKQRAEVRKSFDKGLSVVIEKTANRHFRVYSESVRNLGTPVFPKALFDALLHFYGDAADVLTVMKDTTPVASVLSLYHKGEVLPYYGGGTAAARELRANDFMYFKLMSHAVARGCTSFDFGRSKVGTGAYAFKKNWGFLPMPLVYEYRLAEGAVMPDINPMNPKYKLMIDAWQKLPLGVANIIGPHIAKNLG
jgi:FemAB-related protein (PEP-CTERM system-associated)